MRLALAFVLLASVASADPIYIHGDPNPVWDCTTDGAVTADEVIAWPTTRVNMCVRSGATVTVRSLLLVTNLRVDRGGTLILEDGTILRFKAATPFDIGQYGTGLVVDGTIRANGQYKVAFARLSVEPLAGISTLLFDVTPAGWKVGDELVFPDTRHLKASELSGSAPTAPQYERRTISFIAEGAVQLNAPLAFDHKGARNADGELEFLPHVANMTHSILVESEAGAAAGMRGHTLYTQRADVDIRYTTFRNLGRTTIDALNATTNVIGRYAVHFHKLIGPVTAQSNGYQFTFIGNSIDGGDTNHRHKWGVAVHGSHYGLIQGNALYNWAGAAMMFEDGSESYNLVDGNFAFRSKGEGNRLAIGVEGGGLWFKGPNNYVRNNVVANAWGNQPDAAYGYKFFLYYLGEVKIPAYQGADPNVAGQFVTLHGNKLPILEFTNNEVYAVAQGMTYWWVNSQSSPTEEWSPGAQETVFRDTRIWHAFNIAIYHYPAAKITFDGLTIRAGQFKNVSGCCMQGFFGSDYAFRDLTLRHLDVQGLGVGINPPMFAFGPMTIEHSSFRNDVDITVKTMWNVGGGSNIKPRTITIRNTTHAPLPGRAHIAINKVWNTTEKPASSYNLPVLDETKVYAFNGNPTDNFQVYYAVQATQNVAGGLAPAGATTRADIAGIVSTIPGETPIPATYGPWTLESWGAWEPASCPVSEQQTRPETWTHEELTPPLNGGATEPLSEQRTGTKSCVYVPPTVTCEIQPDGSPLCVMSGWPLTPGRTFSLVVPEP